MIVSYVVIHTLPMSLHARPGQAARKVESVCQDRGLCAPDAAARAGRARSGAGPATPARGRPPSARSLRLCLLALLAVLLVPPAPAQAHALLIRSNPASGATLAQSPRLVQLWFSEELALTHSSLRLVDATGHTVPGIRPIVTAQDPTVLAAELPPIGHGTYGLLWQAMAADDGHSTGGTVVFNVAVAAASALRSEAHQDASLDVLARWLRLAAFAVVTGAVGVSLFVVRWPRGSVLRASRALRDARRNSLWMGAVGCAMGVCAAVIGLLLEQRRSGGSLFDAATSGRWAHLWLGQLCCLFAALSVFLMLLSRSRWPAPSAIALGGTVVALSWIEALGSHASAVRSPREAAVAAAAMHTLAALMWLGAVAVLLVVLWRSAARTELIGAIRGPFSVLAATSVVVILISGLYSAGLQVPTVDDLFGTGYGRTLLVKVALLAAMGGFGLANAAHLRNRSIFAARTRRRWWPLIATEVAVGVGLLLAASVLVGQSPLHLRPVAATAPAGQTVTAGIADLVITASVTPNQPGVNWLALLVDSSRRPAPAPVDSVRVALGLDNTDQALALQQLEPGRYFATFNLDRESQVSAQVIVTRARQHYSASLHWQLASAPQPAGSGRRLAPFADVAAILFATLVVAALAALARRGLRRRRDVVATAATPALPTPDLVGGGQR